MTRYRTIVADPPWPYPEGWGRLPGGQGERMAVRNGDVPMMRERKPLPYPAMTLDGCHVYMWTTNRYLRQSFSVFDAWGARFGQMLVWAKTPMGLGPGGTFAQASEYILFGRIGTLRYRQRCDSTWFNWPRMDRAHSRKPDAFLDLVEQVSPGPYLELFARRQRLGWDTWGDEALEHVRLSPALAPVGEPGQEDD